MGLAVGTAKYLLFFFNFIFFATGIFIIVVGALVKNGLKDIADKASTDVTLSIPIFIIIVGVVVTIISFFGCCGAIRNSYCMLITFAVLLGVIFVFEFAAGIAAYVNKDKIEDTVKDAVKKLFEDYYNDTSNVTRESVDGFQEEFKCCGPENSTFWTKNPTNATIPCSCYPKEKCGVKEEIYTKGCYNAFVDNISSNVTFVGGVGIGVAFIQLLGIVLACCLASAVKDHV